MNRMEWKFERHAHGAFRRARGRGAFTLIEILVVVTIVGILLSLMGAVITNSVRKAREAATTALILKIDGLLEERIKGFDRATKSRDFQRTIEAITAKLLNQGEDNNNNNVLDPGEDLNANGVIDRGVLRLSPKVIEVTARKEYFRQYFPQRFEELEPNTQSFPPTTLLPKVMQDDPQIGASYIPANHRRRTESSALLYYALTRMNVFGVPPVGESEFATSEVRDTDGDGLMEFVDAWGRPLRFYRWPTRLLKPNGAYGVDGIPFGNSFGNEDSNGNMTLDPGEDKNGNSSLDLGEYGRLGADDVVVPANIREMAGLLIDGLGTGPVLTGQWDVLSEDPDDPYGLITTELKRQFASNVHAYPVFPTGSPTSSSRFEEPFFPTLDTYHTPLVMSVGPDGSRTGFQDTGVDTEEETGLGLFEPWQGIDTNGDGIPDSELGILGQPRGLTVAAGQYVIPATLLNALTDNLTNRNRRAGRGK